MANSTETRTPSSPRSGAEPDRSTRLPGRKRGATIGTLRRGALPLSRRRTIDVAHLSRADGQTSHIDEPTTYPPVRRTLERGRPS